MIARVPHLVIGRGDREAAEPAPRHVPQRLRRQTLMHIHDLAPRRARTAPRAASDAAPAARAARPPAEARRASSARSTVKPGFEGGQLPLTQRIPKLRGFENPFRVEYNVVNLDALEALERRRGHARDAQGRPASSTTRASSRCSGAASCTGRVERRGARLLRSRPCGDRGRRRHASTVARRRRTATGGPRCGATRSPTARLIGAADGAVASRRVEQRGAAMLSSLRNIVRVADLRNKVLFTLLVIAHLPARREHPRARRRASRRSRRSRTAPKGPGHPRLPRPVLRRRARPCRGPRARDHAVHHLLDHRPAARHGDPEVRASGASRARSASASSPRRPAT